jgi:hypothetical protein
MHDHEITQMWRELATEIRAKKRAKMARELGIVLLAIVTMAAAAAWITYHL